MHRARTPERTYRPITDTLVTYDHETGRYPIDGADDQRHAYRLRQQADAILAAACYCHRDEIGRVIEQCTQCAEIGTEPDIYVNGHLETRPDRVAFRGVSRYRLPARHRQLVNRAVTRWTHLPIDDGTYVWQMDAPAWRVTMLAVRIDRRVLVGAPGMVGSHGRRWTAVERTPMDRQHRRTMRRKAAPRKPGRVASPWSMSARSLPRVWSKATAEQHALAARWVDLFVTSADDVPVTIGPLTVTRDGAARVIPAGHTAMTMQEAARRAALAGMVPD